MFYLNIYISEVILLSDDIYNVLPNRIKEVFRYEEDKLNQNNIFNDLVEIRIRINKPIIFRNSGRDLIYINNSFVDASLFDKNNKCEYLCASLEDVNEMIDLVSDYSLYAFEDDLRQGYITIKGGHRVGIAGKVVIDMDRVKNIKNISFLNLRIAHQIKGCAKNVMPYIQADRKYLHTLIISPPGCGKTTLLRDIIRTISDGDKNYSGRDVGVVDERSEIAACYMGLPQNDVGFRTDVLDNCPKATGMLMLLRTMNPEVIAVDEIGDSKDVEAIRYVINCGCTIIATIHGDSIDEIRTRPIIRKLIDERVFDRYIILGKSMGVGTINNIFDERGNELLKKPFSTEEYLEVY